LGSFLLFYHATFDAEIKDEKNGDYKATPYGNY